MHDVAYDAIHDEIVVTGALTQAILTFRGGANGQEPPLRVIQGSKTQILGVGALDKVTVDPDNNEILLGIAGHKVLVFPREANGDVAPIRVLGGPDTQIRFSEQRDGGGNTPPIRVDPIRNLLIVPSGGSFLVFDRTASGNAKPRAVIRGPRTGHQFQIYPPKGLIITHRSGAIEGWNIEATGDAAPLWRIPTEKFLEPGREAGTGLVLDPLHKEIIVSTGAGNTIMTFHVPEIFD
jgi:hypothetical protein